MSKKRKYIALKRYGKIVSLLVKEFKQKNKGKKSDLKKLGNEQVRFMAILPPLHYQKLQKKQ